MTTPAVFPYRPLRPGHAGPTLMPLLPIRLSWGKVSVDLDGLVDSGAMVSVLPIAVGLRLGLDWARAPAAPALGGNLGGHPTKLVTLVGAVAGFQPVQLAFSW